MKSARMNIFGKRVEVRIAGLFQCAVLIDGRPFKSERWWTAGLASKSLFFEMEDEQGVRRNMEACITPGLFKDTVRVLADGRLLHQMKTDSAPGEDHVCRHCLYPLEGLTPENGEYRCPECGRHTPAAR